jgi:TRAP-type C4-dicarboxylate transport system permease small subunit
MVAFASIGLVIMVSVFVVNIILRRIFNRSIFGSTEIISYLSLYIASLGLGHQEWIHNNITMTVLVETFRPRIQLLFHTVVSIICFVGFTFATYFLGNATVKRAIAGDLTPTLRVPRAIPYGFLTLCFVWLCVCLVVETGLYLTAFIKYDDKKAAEVLTGKAAVVEIAEKTEIGGAE